MAITKQEKNPCPKQDGEILGDRHDFRERFRRNVQ